MVDASAAFRMNPLAALSIDRNALIGENLRPPGGIFYPGINPLSVEKPQEPGTSIPIGYNLLYKPDVSLLEGQKPTNGFVGLYKNPPPGLQKPLVVPVDGLGLERRAGDKPSELGSSFLRLPWFTPYADASMYPFLDMAYKASFLSQPSPFLHQQLAYQSLCVAGAGGSTPGEERLFYLPPYAAAHISSPMGPPIGIPTATPAPAVLSPLAHCQEKALQGLGPQVHQEPSAFSTSPHIHQTVHHSERSQHTSTKNSISSSGSNSSSSGGSSNVPVNSSASTAALESVTKPSTPSNTSDLQKSLYRSTSSSSTSLSASHPFYVGSASSERCNKTKDISSDRCNSEKCLSPAKTTVERAVPQMPAKKTGDKPLDLSAKELEGFPSKLEVLAKLGYLPPSRYGLLSSQEHHLKEGLSPPASMSAKIPDRPEMISTAPSPWVVPGPSQIDPSKVSQVVKNKSVESVSVQQQSSSASSIHSPASGKRPPESSPSSQSKVERPSDSEKVLQSSKAEPRTCLVKQTPAKSDAQDNQPQTSIDNGNQSTQIYCDSYLPPGLGYTNRYVPYSVAESMSLQCMTIQGKGPVYPHPVLFGSGSFYPPRLAPKHGLPYGVHPNQGDYLAYQKSQEMAPTSVASQPGLDTKDQLEDRSKCQDKPWNVERSKKILSADCDNKQDNSTNQIVKVSGKSHPSARDDVVCIDLVRDEADFTEDLSNNKPSTTRREESSKHGSSDSNQIQGEQSTGLFNHTSEPLNHNSCPSGEEIPEETPDEEEEQLSPLPDIPEEQTMRCARTSPHQFLRKNKTGASLGLVEVGVSGGNNGTVGTNIGNEANIQSSASGSTDQDTSGSRKSPESQSDSDKTTGVKCGVASPKSPANGESGNPVCSGNGPDFQVPQNRSFNPRVPVGGVFNTRPSTCINTNTNSGDLSVINRNFMGSHCRNFPVRSSAGEPFRTTVLMTQNCNRLNRNAVRLNCGNIPVLACGRNNFGSLSADQTFGNNPNSVNSRVSTFGGSIPTFQHLSLGNATANFSNMPTDSPPEGDKNCNGLSCDDKMETLKPDSRIQVGSDVLLDEDDGPGCSRSRRSGLTKRIANSSGYVGDRLKCVTTELYADASQLSREQRALQRAMLRFSELELKEKEGGGREEEEEEEEGEEELADGQRRDEEEEGEEGEGEGEKKEAGGGRTPSAAAAAEAPRGLHPSCPQSRLPIPPMCRHPDDDKNNEDVAARVFQDDMKNASGPDPQQRFVSAARGLFQGKVSTAGLGSLNPSVALNRRRIFSLEPFHQSSIISSKLKRGREDETEEDDRTDNHKNKLNSDSTLDDVKKLKVCIELNGLRLNKPRLPGEIGHWLPSGQRSAELGRGRSEVNGGWCDPTFVRRDGVLPSAPVFHVTPPSSPAHLPRQQCSPAPRHPGPASFSSLASSRLLDKHQRLRENRRVSGLLPSFPPLPPSSSSSPPPLHDPHQFRCHGDDPDKPKGKRPCKMKHTGGGEEARGSEEEEDEEEMVSSSDLPRPPLQSPAPSATRPAPPEVRRLIVNKNAGETLLQRAARLGYEEVVLYCLERQICDVNHKDNAGYCALHEACSRGWLSIVRHLVEHGADVNCSAQDGTRPLHDAVENDHVEVVRFLLACGADPTLTSYSGRGPINMTHSANMETFLEDYLSDLQGRADGDPGIYWEFHGSSVCETSNEGEVYNILADPPGPEEEEEDEHEDDDVEQRARREVFEFELSDRPLLPCYNIQVSLCQGPRNWLLLSDVLGRLRMTSKSFRRLFPQLNVQSIPEDEFYRQASLSQLLTGPDEQELASFRPDVKDPLELVEATPELAGMLGSSLEFVDSRWDSMEASPPATPPPPASPAPVLHIPVSLANSRTADPGVKVDKVSEDRSAASVQGPKNHASSTAETAKMETKMDARTWESHPQGNKNIPSLANPSVILNANIWEQQKLRSKTMALNNFANPDSKLDSSAWEQQQHKNKTSSSIPDTTTGANMWEPQRLRSRNTVTTNTVTSDAKVDPEPQRLRSKTTGNPVNSNGKLNANVWKQQNQGGKNAAVLVSTNDGSAVDGTVWEPQRLRSKNAAISCSSKSDSTADANIWERKGVKRQVENSTETKREANSLETQTLGPKTFKLDASWPRNFGNVRVHIRDLGLSVGIGNIRKDVKKEQGKVVGKTSRIKTRS